ncbi:Glucuronoxylan 4-O-methyltransferase 2 [Dichanthelium oligosanthes]|uniref:Glucuronoxylan 4-O-methyltransferase 2 n=1 Tax=Dichanthelium oligosanthes TaxID=888268 RepID=A0A1E5WDX1_9POAL|nr:Glucuronoxylan 4-O-methyltransferase 2 [Dichanthelium oligosanthes]
MTSPTIARKAKLKNQLVSAKAKLKHHVTPRRVVLLAAAAFSAFLILLTLRTIHTAAEASRRARAGATTTAAAASTPAAVAVAVHKAQQQRECTKNLPASVTETLVHYATSNETPRQTEAEAGAAARVLARRAPCNLLVFGLSPDSALWAALNHGGRTLFLEADAERIASARAAHPAGLDLQAHPVTYQQQEHSATISVDDLLALRNSSDCAASPPKPLSPDHVERSPCALAPRGLPPAFYEAEWDVIMVDAPVPGAVYTAGVAARARRPGTGETDVLVHGVDGTPEESFTRAFLCEGYIKEEAGRLRHFAIPSHRDKEDMPFCP